MFMTSWNTGKTNEPMWKKAKTETLSTDEMVPVDLQPLQVPPKWPSNAVDRPPMDKLFRLCRENKWNEILDYVNQYPLIGNHCMTMDNHITTTIIHQAITSKGDTTVRARVISAILKNTPEAAKTKNGYGSMPLHVIAQRNTKIDSTTKERLINEIIDAYPEALTEAGGVGKRTPLHIIFTDYVSARLTKRMIDIGGKACFMKDKHGYLPAHVACRRHTSPDKLRMLLAVNPGALFDRNNDGFDLLGLAKKHATKSHPNFALIEELKRQMENTPHDHVNMFHNAVPAVSSEDTSEATRERLDSNEAYARWQGYAYEPYAYDDNSHKKHCNEPSGRYEPHVVSYQTMVDPQGTDQDQYQHGPRLQTFQYDPRDLAPIPFSPSGSATVSGSQYHFESGSYQNPPNEHNTDHYGYPGSGHCSYRGTHVHGSESHAVVSPSYRPHGQEMYHRRETDPRLYMGQQSGTSQAKFNGHVDTFASQNHLDAFHPEGSPRFGDLSPHSTDFVFDSSNDHRKRKAGDSFSREEIPDPISSVQEEAAGASLLLHFSRQAVDEKEPDDTKPAYRGADLLFEEV